jgi:hypothetical protein
VHLPSPCRFDAFTQLVREVVQPHLLTDALADQLRAAAEHYGPETTEVELAGLCTGELLDYAAIFHYAGLHAAECEDGDGAARPPATSFLGLARWALERRTREVARLRPEREAADEATPTFPTSGFDFAVVGVPEAA